MLARVCPYGVLPGVISRVVEEAANERGVVTVIGLIAFRGFGITPKNA